MAAAVMQTLLATIACALLFVAFRRLRGAPATDRLLAVGLLARAAAAQGAFWISYLQLPVGRSMQRGNGFWFYGSDGVRYFRRAVAAAGQGAEAIFSIDPSAISPVYTQFLALACAGLGPVPSVGILLNSALFLATCAIVLALAQGGAGGKVAIAALSLSPALILWTTQPLKDIFFVFLLTAFAGAAAWMMTSWERGERGLRAAAPAIAAIVVLYSIAGVRWYVVLALLVASVLPLLVTAWRSPSRQTALVSIVVVYAFGIAAMSQMAGGFVPRAIQELFGKPSAGRIAAAPRMPAQLLTGARSAFEQLPGATRILPGKALRSLHPTVSRLATGTAALLLPPSVARAAGLCEIGGGRGLWLIADVDSLVFLVILAIAAVAALRAFRTGGARTPLLCLVLLAAVTIAVAVIYSVTNYGALFRYRSMVFALLALVPAIAPRRSTTTTATSPG